MANGCVDQRVTKDTYQGMTPDEKLNCLWDVIVVMQNDMKALKRYGTSKMIAGSFAGGAVAILVLKLLGVSLLG